jgi:SOS-response transcriptional repressor LexA
MTPDQRDCLRVICEWFDQYGRAPSYREIAREMDTGGGGGIHNMVSGLVERGWLTRTPHQRNGLTVLHRPPMPDFSTREIACLGIPF